MNDNRPGNATKTAWQLSWRVLVEWVAVGVGDRSAVEHEICIRIK